MNTTYLVSINDKGQILFPKKIRDELGLKNNSKLPIKVNTKQLSFQIVSKSKSLKEIRSKISPNVKAKGFTTMNDLYNKAPKSFFKSQ